MLKQKFVLDFGSKIFVYVIGGLTGIVVARVAGPSVVGTVAYGFSFVSMFGFIFGLFGTSHIKLISGGEDLGKCNRIYSTLMSSSVLIYIFIVLTYFLIKKNIYDSNLTQEEQIVIFISMIVVSVQSLFKIGEVTFIALTQQAKANIPSLFRAIIYNLGRIVVVLMGFGAVALATVNLISSMLVIPVYIYILRNLSFKNNWDWNLFKKYLRIGFPILIITMTNSIMANYGKVMLKDSSSTIELGYYAGGVSIAGMLMMFGHTAGTVFFPLFSKAFANNDINYIKIQIEKYERFLFLFGFPIFISLSLFSDPIIPFLMGNKYLASVPVFSILVFASFFSIWGMPYYNLINGMNKFNVSAILNILFFVFFISLIYSFVNPDIFNLGAIGLAWSLVILNFLKLLFWNLYNRITIQIGIGGKITNIVLINITFFAIIFFVKTNYLTEVSVFIQFIFALFTLILLYIILFALKILDKNDLMFFIDIFNIKELFNYSKNELKK